MRVLRIAATYFGLIFSVGFVLGTLRTLWLAPRVGVRAAELGEAPIMLFVTTLVAQALVRRYQDIRRWQQWFGIGATALTFLLLAEFTVVLWLRGLSLREYFDTRDPLSGAVYAALLGWFALAPLILRVGRSPQI